MPDHLLTQKEYLLQQFPGKGGWTYAEIPEVPMDRKAPFGWVCVKGSIDGHHFRRMRLMPMGNGRLFFTVNAALRKKIGKTAGDRVLIELFPDDSEPELPAELAACLQDEPLSFTRFQQLPAGEKERIIKWIDGAKTTETKARRVEQLVRELTGGHSPLHRKAG